MKKIWIINHYAGNMLFDKGGRHYWFAKFLNRLGYECVIFCCNIKHNPGTEMYVDSSCLWVEKVADEIDTPFVYVKAKKYKKNGIKRVFNMIDFYHNVQKAVKEYSINHGKPDIILASSVHPLSILAGLKLSKYFKIKCISEVRDLWPEAILAYSKKIKKNGFFAKLLYTGEKYLYKKSDAVIFTQEGGPDYIRERRWDKEHGGPIDMNKMFHINNGVDLEAFDQNLKQYSYNDDDLDNAELFKVVYAGAVRRINNVGILLDAAKLVKNEKIKFIIFGNGEELEILKKRVVDENITNVVFKGRVNKRYIPSIDSKADLNLVHWEMNPLLRVGESYNKAFEYFAAGKPVFYTIRPDYSIVEKFKCGKLTDGFAPEDIAAGIDKMSLMTDSEKRKMAENARNAAKVYDFNALTTKLIDVIEKF